LKESDLKMQKHPNKGVQQPLLKHGLLIYLLFSPKTPIRKRPTFDLRMAHRESPENLLKVETRAVLTYVKLQFKAAASQMD
jgi:hypothetical protein